MQVGVVPSDLERSIAFYRDVIGLAYTAALPVMAGRTLHLFDGGTGGGTLKLIELGPDDPTPVAGISEPFTAGLGARWITFDVDDIAAIDGRAGPRARWQLRPVELRPGLVVAIVNDPDGVAVELVQRTEGVG